jgi:hypothetical protein
LVFGFAFAKDLNRLLLSFLRAGGAGVLSLLEAVPLPEVGFSLELVLLLAKNSFAVDGWDLGSVLGLGGS